jgi:putative NADH-flavin reductase
MISRRILVLGGTGGTGRHVVRQALDKGHAVTAFVRSPERLKIESDHLRVLIGDVTSDGPALPDAVRDQDVVISALGVGNSLKSGGLIARSIPAIVRAMERQAVHRLIFTSAFGVGRTYQDVPFLPRVFIRTLLRDLYADKTRGEDELFRIGNELDWTLVYPVSLTNGPATGRYRAGERLELHGVPRISRADVADFILSQVDDVRYLRKGVLLSP